MSDSSVLGHFFNLAGGGGGVEEEKAAFYIFTD